MMARFAFGDEDELGGGNKRKSDHHHQQHHRTQDEDDDESDQQRNLKKLHTGIRGRGEEELDNKEPPPPPPTCASGGGSENSGIPVRIDLDVLDCAICYEPLRPPVFQCRNGHVACYSCCSKLGNKCHSCSDTIGYSRCLALEKVIESIKIPCSNEEYGCKQTFSYSHKHAHEETCIHAPCFCPIGDCSFRGSIEMLLAHLSGNHHHSVKSFCYSHLFKVSLEQAEPFLVLHAEDGHLFILFNRNVECWGHALSMAFIRSRTLSWDFTYELTASHKENTLQVRASTTNFQKKIPDCPANIFLMVPVDFFSCGKICLDVCIRKNRSEVIN